MTIMTVFNISGVILLVSVCGVQSYITKINYIHLKCGSTIWVSSAEIIRLEPGDADSILDCQVKLVAYDQLKHDNIKVQASFVNINLPCHEASIIIDKFDNSGIGTTICGNEVPELVYESNLKQMTIKFHKKVPGVYGGSFDILVTRVNRGHCEGRGFECNNGLCIDDLLTCDDYNNCGDNSDEVEGCFWTDGVIAAVVIAGIASIVIVICGVILIYRKVKYGTIMDRKPKIPPALVHPPEQPYFVQNTRPYAQNLTPVYAPSLSYSMTPRSTPQSDHRNMISSFQQNDGPRVSRMNGGQPTNLDLNETLELEENPVSRQMGRSSRNSDSSESVPRQTGRSSRKSDSSQSVPRETGHSSVKSDSTEYEYASNKPKITTEI